MLRPNPSPQSDEAASELQQEVAKLRAEVQAVKAQIAAHNKERRSMALLQAALFDLHTVRYLQAEHLDDHATRQEAAWAGLHGYRYVLGHIKENWKGSRIPYWQVIMGLAKGVTSVAEFGCNIGANLKALREINTALHLQGVELNSMACDLLSLERGIYVRQGSVIDVDLGRMYDLVFSRGVLIHLNPDELDKTLINMGRHSSRYVLIYEIYSDEPYHLESYSAILTGAEKGVGYQFWRDFPAEFARLHPGWKIVGRGVHTKVDQEPKHGDIYWNLFERP